jgi:hypothetical protein
MAIAMCAPCRPADDTPTPEPRHRDTPASAAEPEQAMNLDAAAISLRPWLDRVNRAAEAQAGGSPR